MISKLPMRLQAGSFQPATQKALKRRVLVRELAIVPGGQRFELSQEGARITHVNHRECGFRHDPVFCKRKPAQTAGLLKQAYRPRCADINRQIKKLVGKRLIVYLVASELVPEITLIDLGGLPQGQLLDV